MHTLTRRWHIASPAPKPFASEIAPLSPILAQILYNRGLTNPGDARAFLDNDYELPSPFLLEDMGRAKGRIMNAIYRREPIAVYGDFDVDGVTATAILASVLRRMGACVHAYIPDRLTEGYGLNMARLRRLAQEGIRLVITVDCGIRSVQEIAEANAAGLDMIVTDHHTLGPELPPAYAIIDPKRPSSAYPYRELCGAGVAYTLARALADTQNRRQTPPFDPDEYLDFVALGTVADLVPLTGENRYLAARGIQVLNRTRRPGLLALMQVAHVAPGEVDAGAIGFRLGPRLNAAGRLETARFAYRLLSTHNPRTARRLALMLQGINQSRQMLTGEMQDIAAEQAARFTEAEDESPPLIFAADPDFHQGIVGLVASRLTEQAYRPAVVVERGDEHSHGSCRSIPEFHITDALDQCADLLVRHGGHAAAAGFTVHNENIGALRDRLLAIATEQLGGRDLTPTLSIDAEVDLHHLTEDLIAQLDHLEPTGVENPRPLLATRNLRVADARVVGREGNHLKLRVFDGKYSMDAIAFRWGHVLNRMPDYVDLAYHAEINEWRSRRSVQMVVEDIRPSER